MAAEGGAIVTFIFNGEDRAFIPRDVTHLIIHENITVIPFERFFRHPNLVEIYCHQGVTKIEKQAFFLCPSLRRVIIPGVTVLERFAFSGCCSIFHVECPNLERIGDGAFSYCESLSSINLSSVKIVGEMAFYGCPAITQAIFGKELESIGGSPFCICTSLGSITIPLRNDLFTENNTFSGCVKLESVDLIDGDILRKTIDALLLESWKHDLNILLDSINEILLNADPGDDCNVGGKTIAIRDWIGSLLRKIIYYKAAHRELLVEAAAVLQLSLPNDLVMNNILPFVELPAHTFDGEDDAG